MGTEDQCFGMRSFASRYSSHSSRISLASADAETCPNMFHPQSMLFQRNSRRKFKFVLLARAVISGIDANAGIACVCMQPRLACIVRA